MRVSPRVWELGPRAPLLELLPKFASEPQLCLWDGSGEWSWLHLAPLGKRHTPRSWAELRAACEELEIAPASVPGPFRGGFVGALSYDLGVADERPLSVDPDPWHAPPIVGGMRADFLVRQQRSGATWLVLGERSELSGAALQARAAQLIQCLDQPASTLAAPRALGPLQRDTSAEEHCHRIQRLRADIARGAYYQANLAHRFTRTVSGHPLAWYARLCALNPAPYRAYLDFGSGALLSASPELLLETQAGRARTRPIKGTRRRVEDREADAQLARELLASAKDRAELAMIVDLSRNDLGRVARVGSVQVDGAFPRLESYAGVHHLMADVVAQLREDRDSLAALAALFPGASISGAPKLASMAAIAREERVGRGFFTGSLGWLDRGGDSCWNILIRTLVYRELEADRAEFCFHVGGGITFSSDPLAEEEETLVKAARLIRVLSP